VPLSDLNFGGSSHNVYNDLGLVPARPKVLRPVAAPIPKKHHGGIAQWLYQHDLGLIPNLIKGVSNLQHIPSGLAAIGEAGYHDIKGSYLHPRETISGYGNSLNNLVHGRNIVQNLVHVGIAPTNVPHSQLDSIYRQVLPGLVSQYAPAAEGIAKSASTGDPSFAEHGLKKSARLIYDDPLGPVLDVIAITTGGAGLAAKGAGTVQKASAASRALKGVERVGRIEKAAARVTGLHNVRVPAGMTPTHFAESISSGQGVRSTRAYTIPGNKTHILAPIERRISEPSGLSTHLGHYSLNPATRVREKMADIVSHAFPSTPIVGATRRYARLVAQKERRIAQNLSGEQLSGIPAARAALKTGSRSAAQELGVPAKQVARSLEAALPSLSERVPLAGEVARLSKEAAALGHSAHGGIAAAKSIARVAKKFGRIRKTEDRLRAAGNELAAIRVSSAAVKKLAKDTARLAASKAIDSKQLLRVEHAAEELIPGYKANQDLALSRRAKIVERRVAKHYAESRVTASSLHKYIGSVDSTGAHLAVDKLAALRTELQNPAAFAETKTARAEQLSLADRILNDTSTGHATVNAILHHLSPALEGQAKAYEKAGVRRGNPVAVSQYIAGKRGGDVLAAARRPVYRINGREVASDTPGAKLTIEPVAQVYPRSMLSTAIGNRAESAGVVRKGARTPGNARRRTGAAQLHGMDAVKLTDIPQMVQSANRWVQGLRTWQTLEHAMRPASEVAGDRGWVVVPHAKLQQYLERAKQYLGEEFPLAFGADNPQLLQAQEVFTNLIDKVEQHGPLAVPKGLEKRLMDELSARKVVKPLDVPTGVWRLLVVSPLRPAFVVNNFLGQTAQTLLNQGILNTMRPMLHAAADPEARKALDLAWQRSKGGLSLTGPSTVGRETGQLLQSGGFAQRLSLGLAAKAGTAEQFLSKLSGALTDDPFRRLSFSAEMLGPARRIAAADGITLEHAMRQLLDDPVVLDRVQRKVFDDLVDFNNLSSGERDIVRRYLNPFYSWTKGSTRMTALLVHRRPILSATLYHAGQLGKQQNDKALGPVPEFVSSLIPLGGSKNAKGQLKRGQALTTASVNPFQTPADFIQQIAGATGLSANAHPTGAESPLSALNPVVKAAFSAASGIDPFTGQAVQGSSEVERFVNALGSQIPQLKAYQNARSAGQSFNQNTLYRRSLKNEVSKYLGVPIRDVNYDQARHLQANPRDFAQLAVPVGGGKQFSMGPDGQLYLVLAINPSGHGKRVKKLVPVGAAPTQGLSF